MLDGDVQPFICVNCWDEVSKSITIECGHKICMSCFWKKSSSSSCCTSCWEFSHLKTLQHDIVMYPEGEGMCEIHREEQKYFCDANRTLLCVTCSKSEEHIHHIHWPISVAALSYRKKIKLYLAILNNHQKKIQELLFQEKERSLAWIIKCNDYRDIPKKIYEQKVHVVLKYMKGKEKKLEKEELILEKIEEKFNELYQKLKKTEATQECKILEQKKEWETMMYSQSRLLTDTITELQEQNQKPDLEMLRDVTAMMERGMRRYNLKPFIPRVDTFYLMVVADFLKFYHRFKLLENCNHYTLSDDKKRTITFISDSSGNTSAVYTTGNVEAEAIQGRELLNLWSQDRIVDKEGCARKITIASGFISSR
ncbi:tripartite motif-containing protein 43-like [Trichosurus vulpecula]|uniref:tripartite motif-containing protein 43-like n=1 Tax=Trichosurus vulpecula TaxID=9337 RepID=UPI00186B1CEB|nr:tripartite motif-containing protein 43-like [Trichosurus vulpecula]